MQTAAINQALIRWNEPNGCLQITQKLLAQPKPTYRKFNKRKKHDTNLQACRRKLGYGHYSAAIRILSSNGVAPATADTLQDLHQKHPYAPSPTIPTDDISVPSLSVDATAVLSALKSFPKGTSYGRDGLRAQHLLDAMSGAAAVVADDLPQSITGVVNLWLAGKCPKVLGEFVASAPLTPLLKLGGGIRPIIVGTIWRRLCSKVAAAAVSKDMTSYPGSYQFGVGIPCGGQGIMHAVNKLLVLKGNATP